MKAIRVGLVAAIIGASLIAAPARAGEPNTCSCEKRITVKLSQTSYTLDIWKHVRNVANAVTFQLPVPCSFYDEVQVGQDLLTSKFRWGSLAVNGSFGNWNLEVVGK
jgi:hypothetical protein